MSKKRYFDTKFWSDTWIVDTLNPLDRYLYMYLILNEKTNIAGVYELPLRTMANEVGLDKEEVIRMLKRLEPKAYYRDGWVVLVNAIRHQNYKNKFIAEGIRTELCKAPQNLLELVHIPEDMDHDLTCDIQDSSGHLQDSRVIESNINLIKSNSKADKSAGGFVKSKTLNKKTYAKAVAADNEQEHRISNRGDGSGYSSLRETVDKIKQKKGIRK